MDEGLNMASSMSLLHLSWDECLEMLFRTNLLFDIFGSMMIVLVDLSFSGWSGEDTDYEVNRALGSSVPLHTGLVVIATPSSDCCVCMGHFIGEASLALVI